eukprot:3661390-Prymnesium_polylepis.1
MLLTAISNRTRSQLKRNTRSNFNPPNPCWQRDESRPRYNGQRGACHAYHPELSGGIAPPNRLQPSLPAITLQLHAIGGRLLLFRTRSPIPLVPPPSSRRATLTLRLLGHHLLLLLWCTWQASAPSATSFLYPDGSELKSCCYAGMVE